jgi:4,5-dihydroxyphthalate decarboxylase
MDEFKDGKVGLPILACALAPGPLTNPLLAGDVEFGRFEASFCDLPLRVIFNRALGAAPFDLCELSFGRYIQALARDGTGLAYAGLPVFTMRKFRHDIIYVRDDGDIENPQALMGCRIGVPSWAQTALVTCRGHLLDEHGLSAARMRWALGGVNAPATLPLPQLHRADIEISASPRAALSDSLASGEIDAVMALEAPLPPVGSRVRFRPLIGDAAVAAEEAYCRSGFVPIMHLVAIRRDRVAGDPEISADILATFERARTRAMQEGNAEAATSPIGIDPNRAAIAAMLRHALDQGLIEQPLEIASLFS